MTQTTPPWAIFLMGPTASGKTDLAIELVKRFPCEIISVDSALIYRGMDIGTAKPTAEEQAIAPHRMIDILDPAEVFSAADFCQQAQQHIDEITAKGNIPLLVGGTMMYYKALLEGLSTLPQADAEVRAAIQQQADQHGWQSLHDELRQVDPLAAARIHPNDPQRLNRAIEVYRLTGVSLSEHIARQEARELPFTPIQFSIMPDDRAVLHQRIEQRFQMMLEQGFEQEVRQLHARGDLHPGLPSIRCVGYRQMWSYLDGEYDYDEMVFRGIVATRQLAKRQVTWLRGWEGVHTLDSLDPQRLDKLLALLPFSSSGRLYL